MAVAKIFKINAEKLEPPFDLQKLRVINFYKLDSE